MGEERHAVTEPPEVIYETVKLTQSEDPERTGPTVNARIHPTRMPASVRRAFPTGRRSMAFRSPAIPNTTT